MAALQKIWMAVCGAIATILALLSKLHTTIKASILQTINSSKKPKRRMSVNSELFARGPFGHTNNPSNIVGTLWIEENESQERLTTTDLEHLIRTNAVLRFERMGSIHQNGFWHPLAAADVDLSEYITQETIANRGEIRDIVSSRLRHAWEGDKLLFRIVLVRVQNDPSVCCVVVDIHHGIGDGLSCVRVLLDLLTGAHNDPLPPMTDFKAHENNTFPGLFGIAWIPFAFMLGMWNTVANTLIIADTQTPLRRPHFPLPPNGSFRENQLRIEYVPSVSLAALKAIKNGYGHGTTINDVCLAALAGAYRHHLQELGVDSDKADFLFRAACPISFSRPTGPNDTELRNRFAILSVPLAVGVPGAPSSRIEATRNVTSKLKVSWDPVAFWFSQLLYLKVLGYNVVAFFAMQYNLRHSIVFTNVPGPTQEAYLAGRKVISVEPSVSGLGTSWALTSYAGRVGVSYNYDPEYLGEGTRPERIGELFLAELKAMMDEVGIFGQSLLFV